MENYTMDEVINKGPKIKVIGAGGGGNNAINYMIEKGVAGVEFAIVNTDIQAIETSDAPEKIQLGLKLTRGLGAGAKPEIGRKAAEESIDDIEKMLAGHDMVFLAVGLGGGTGTGSAPVIAEIARKKGILTVAVVTLPFGFEGKSRMKKALEGKKELTEHVDTIIVIPNDRLTGHLKKIDKKFEMKKAFAEVNNVLLQAVTGITNLITKPGVINLDFADVQTIMSIRGASLMGMGVGKGENRIREATERAMTNPLLERGINGARGILFNITGNENLDFEDFVLANEIISDFVDEDAEIIVGTVLDENIPEDTVYVTVVATGFNEEDKFETKPVRISEPNRVARQTVQEEGAKVETSMKEESYSNKSEPVFSRKTEQEKDEFVTKEISNLYKKLDLPGFMNNLGRN